MSVIILLTPVSRLLMLLINNDQNTSKFNPLNSPLKWGLHNEFWEKYEFVYRKHILSPRQISADVLMMSEWGGGVIDSPQVLKRVCCGVFRSSARRRPVERQRALRSRTGRGLDGLHDCCTNFPYMRQTDRHGDAVVWWMIGHKLCFDLNSWDVYRLVEAQLMLLFCGFV